jgi:hypothetical protein
LENVSVAARAPSILHNLKMYVDAIKAKKKPNRAKKKAFKELECILLISREVWAFLKIYQTDKPMAACMSYNVSSLISNLM